LVFLDLTIGCKVSSERTVWYLGSKVDDAFEMAETTDI